MSKPQTVQVPIDISYTGQDGVEKIRTCVITLSISFNYIENVSLVEERTTTIAPMGAVMPLDDDPMAVEEPQTGGDSPTDLEKAA